MSSVITGLTTLGPRRRASGEMRIEPYTAIAFVRVNGGRVGRHLTAC